MAAIADEYPSSLKVWHFGAWGDNPKARERNGKEINDMELTKEEALSLFCFTEINPVLVLRDKYSEMTDANHAEYYRDLRSMTLLSRIYLSYRSSKTRYIVQAICSRAITEIYTAQNIATIPCSKLMFLFRTVMRYRNLTDYKSIKNVPINLDETEYVRQQLFSLKAIKHYQQTLF